MTEEDKSSLGMVGIWTYRRYKGSHGAMSTNTVAAGEEGEAEVNGPRDDVCSESALVWRLGLVEPSPALCSRNLRRADGRDGVRGSDLWWVSRCHAAVEKRLTDATSAGLGRASMRDCRGEGEGGGAVMPVGLG